MKKLIVLTCTLSLLTACGDSIEKKAGEKLSLPVQPLSITTTTKPSCRSTVLKFSILKLSTPVKRASS